MLRGLSIEAEMSVVEISSRVDRSERNEANDGVKLGKRINFQQFVFWSRAREARERRWFRFAESAQRATIHTHSALEAHI